jgi:hypothetical protein
MVRMKAATLACYAFCLAADAFLGRYELHTDDTGVEVFFILLFTFVLGCWHPRHAWQWAVLVGPCAPAADLLLRPGQTGLVNVTAAVIAFGLVGSYAGVLLRKGISMAAGQAG